MWLTEWREEMDRVMVALYVTVMLRLYGMRRSTGGAQSGQSMVEYAIIVALIAIIAMVGIQAFGQGVQQVFQHLLSKIQSIGS